MKNSELLSALQPVVNAFEKFSIPYYIGGSIASSIHQNQQLLISIHQKKHHSTISIIN